MPIGFSCLFAPKSLTCRLILSWSPADCSSPKPYILVADRKEADGTNGIILMRFCFLTLEEKPGMCIFISVLEVLPSGHLGHRANPVFCLPSSLREEGREKGVSCDRLLRGWCTVSAPVMHEKTDSVNDLMFLKDTGLWTKPKTET